MKRSGWAGRLTQSMAAWLQRQWWQPRPSVAARLLQPLSWLYGAAAAGQRRRTQPSTPWAGPPVIVVGNLIVGGAGKTPTVIALVRDLRSLGFRPGVVSRGHGRRGDEVREVTTRCDAADCGDEPLLIHRRTGAPVWVGQDRVAACLRLIALHPDVDVLIADDGLQHHRLPRALQVMVFDERGVGNGLLLPAGPLRQALPVAVPPKTLVLYNATRPTTPLAGGLADRSLADVLPLADWQAGIGTPPDGGAGAWQQLQRTHGLLAVAGIAVPERFFSMLEGRGLRIERLPLPDHAVFDPLPWPRGAADVLVTEKDAVKLVGQPMGATRVWVVRLDFRLPVGFAQGLRQHLPPPRTTP